MVNKAGAPVPRTLSAAEVARFRRTIYGFYRRHRRSMEWRRRRDPYRIVVSEVMLQQTQVDRVVPKYPAFLRRFPDIRSLAKAPLKSVLEEWQGLGYNRRALFLKRFAEEVVARYRGRVPDDPEQLRELPGIGKATAASIAAFAFNKPVVFIETNIRSVFLHTFFRDDSQVGDAQLYPLVACTLDARRPREWYYALMDYGAFLKKTLPNPSRRSAHYKKQGRFAGSNRQIRGALIRLLAARPAVRADKLAAYLGFEQEAVMKNARRLLSEGLIAKRGDSFSLRS